MQSKSFLPVLVPPLGHSDLKAVLAGIHVSKIDREEDLHELRDELGRRLEFTPHPTPRWNSRCKRFLASLSAVINPFQGPVSRDVHEQLAKQFDAYKSEYDELEKSNESLLELIEELKRTKDAKAVSKIIRARSSVEEQFQDMVQAAAAALRPLPRQVREAFFYRIRGESFVPEDGDWESVKKAEESGQLKTDPDLDAVEVDDRDRKVEKAMHALDRLDQWLKVASDEFLDWYREENSDERAELRLRPFWDRHFR